MLFICQFWLSTRLTLGDDGLALFPSPERCEANRAAGKLIFMTGFDFAAAAGIIEVITADG